MTTIRNYNKSLKETKVDSIYKYKFNQTMNSTFAKHKGQYSKRMGLDPIERETRATSEAGRLLFAKIDNYIAAIHKHN